MKPEKQRLIHDLLARTDSREAVFQAGARVLRRRRRWRYVSRGLIFTTLLAVAAFWIELSLPHREAVTPPAQAQAAPRTSQPEALTDDELLALFPNTPVGLATLADGQKRLIFPHPGDEERFITRL
jgi:hypothetical protein